MNYICECATFAVLKKKSYLKNNILFFGSVFYDSVWTNFFCKIEFFL